MPTGEPWDCKRIGELDVVSSLREAVTGLPLAIDSALSPKKVPGTASRRQSLCIQVARVGGWVAASELYNEDCGRDFVEMRCGD
uniref:Uncharacterized protein n=1 Tax=Peronospora matthiolae TaxID=2874970 RepID=A0AAV1VG56_9STRA